MKPAAPARPDALSRSDMGNRNPPRLDPELEARFLAGAAEATKFFMGESDVQGALDKVARLLEEDGIPDALIGAMALNAYGYRRVTVDVDLLLTREGLEELRTKHLGEKQRYTDLAGDEQRQPLVFRVWF